VAECIDRAKADKYRKNESDTDKGLDTFHDSTFSCSSCMYVIATYPSLRGITCDFVVCRTKSEGVNSACVCGSQCVRHAAEGDTANLSWAGERHGDQVDLSHRTPPHIINQGSRTRIFDLWHFGWKW
jgi:hypothetical protein